MSQLPILKRTFVLQLFFFLFFLLSIFFLNTDDAFARTSCGVAPGSCYPTTCATNVWEGSVLYSDQDNCAVQPYTIVVEYFSDDGCTSPTLNPCPASCTSSADCGGGVCANRSLTADDICSGVVPSGTKWCMGALCGYDRGSCDGTIYTCTQRLPPDGVALYGDLASCQASCSFPPTPTPTPLPPPVLNGSCSANGQTLSYNWNSITGAVRYAIRIDDRANGWDATTPLTGDTINNNVTSPYPRGSTPGNTYDAWVHAVDSRGVYSDASTHSIFTCPVPGVTTALTPTPTSTIPIATPIPGCTSCSGVSGSGFCGGQPPTFPVACNASCSGDWVYQGDSVSEAQCASPFGSGRFPYCLVCSVSMPTPTTDPFATPTPTPVRCAIAGAGLCRTNTPSDIGNCEFGRCSYKTCWGTCSSGENLTTQVHVAECTAGGGNVTGVFWGSYAGSCPTAAPTPIISTVQGIVFIDRNGDGRRQPEGYDRALGTSDDEIGYSEGARLFLNTQTTTTDATGAYQFTGVTSGSYTLELDVPFGFSPNKSTGYNATTGANKLPEFTIPPAVTSADFGIVPYEVGVGGTMYTTVDSNCSTSITSQGRLGSKSLSLLENYFGQTFNASTDIYGVYSFSAPNQTLFPGSYSLTPSGATGMQLVCAVVDPGTASATAVTVSSTPYTYGDDPGENLTLTAIQPQKRVDFYYKLGRPWFQGKGGDMRIDSGFIDPVPTSTFAMLSNSRSPGVIFSGDNSYRFCTAATSICLERASELTNPWVVGGTIYPETFTPTIPGTTRTAYNYLLALVRQNGQTINAIPSTISGRNCYAQPGCDLSALDPGVYTNAAGQGDVYTRDSINNFNSGDYVFLINGNLHIQGKIEVNPNDSALIVSVSGDIKVDKDVGGPPSSSSTHIEGLFSADSDFILESEGTNGDNCPSNEDNRLNMQGAIVVNAQLAGGTFQNNRTLCNNNSDPSVYIEEWPYLILNAPDFLKHKSFVWQEVAP